MTTFIRAGMPAGALLVAALFPISVAAQTSDASSSAQVGQGPMIVERIKSGFLVAPEFKVTAFDHRTSQLAGVYGGWLSDQTFFFGAGGYWMTNGSRDHDMAYGGLVVGWFARRDHPVGVGVKGLIGGGEATVAHQISILQPPIVRGQPPVPGTVTVRIRDDFFVAEPEADVLVRVNKHFRLTGGVGYRLIGGARGEENRVRGVSGSVGLQIGGGS